MGGVNKVVVNGVTKIDLTSDTVTPQSLFPGVTAHDASGSLIEGELLHNTLSGRDAANSHPMSAISGLVDAIPTKTSDLTNDSGFTTNTGTITGITMNGSSKGTSGVVNLGTVLTEHQDISSKANLASPSFTGTPTAPTATSSTSTTQIATTAFVHNASTRVTIKTWQSGDV